MLEQSRSSNEIERKQKVAVYIAGTSVDHLLQNVLFLLWGGFRLALIRMHRAQLQTAGKWALSLL